LNSENEEQEEGQSDSSMEDEAESETEEVRATHLNEEEREKRSAVLHTQAGYAFFDESREKTDDVIRGNDKGGHIEEEVPEISTSTST